MSVSLEKGQRVSLAKLADGGQLTQVFMGLGWDAARGFLGFGGGNIDLDASCLMFDKDKNLVDTVWFRQLKSKDGSIVHSGDNRTGDGDGDDEVISVNLEKVPTEVEVMLFTINSYEGQTFKKVKNASARLVDKTTGKELAMYNLSGEDGGDHTGMLMTKLYRKDGEWRLQAIGSPADGRTVRDILPAVQSYL